MSPSNPVRFKFFGWRRVGKDIRERLQRDIGDLFARRLLTGGPGRINTER